MTSAQIAAIVACAALAGLAVFQGLLIAGAPLGRFAWGGQHAVLPQKLRTSSTIALGLYALFAFVALDRSGLISVLPDIVSVVAGWVLAVYGVLAIGLNVMSRSLPERLAMTPVAVVLAICFMFVALG